MSIRGNPDGTGTPLVGDAPEALVPTPSHREYEVNKTAGHNTIIYDTHHGVKRHVPLIESTKTDIHRAVEDSDPARLADLLDTDLKEKIDQQNCEGTTALHYSVMMSTTGAKYGQKDPDRIACCQLLIEAGANLDIAGQWGQTALQLACISLYPAVECTKMLVDARADLCHIDQWGGTAIHSCAYGTRTMQLKEVMKHPNYEKAKEIINSTNETALQVAVGIYEKQEKKVELAPCHCEVRMLLETGKGLPGPDEEALEKASAKARKQAEAKAAKAK